MRSHHLAKNWQDDGHDTTIFLARFHHLLTADDLPRHQSIDGIEYCALDARRYHDNGVSRILNMADYCRSMLRLNRQDRPDVIIVSSPHPFAIFSGARLAKMHNAKLVFEVRDLWPLSLTEIAGISSAHPIVLLTAVAERYAYRRADVVASLLENALTHMRRRGMAREKFIFVPNGISDDTPPSVPATEAGISASKQIDEWHRQKRKVIIHPGAQGVPNALDRLISAVSILGDDGRFGILLIGNGTETAKLKSQASHLANIAFFDPVPKEEALWLTQQSDIGYAGGRNLPIYRFGTSFNKVADFIRFGLPVVEIIDTGAGVASKDDSPQAIAAAISEVIAAPTTQFLSKHQHLRLKLDYKIIADHYLKAMSSGDRFHRSHF